MNRRVIFETLWLVSERDRAGRKLVLTKPLTIILSNKNGTGKSRITKHLYWVFGCEPPKKNVGTWDPDAVAALQFSYEDRRFLVLRQNDRLAMFGERGLLFASKSMGAWNRFIAGLFGYHLKLQRPSAGNFGQAGMEYLTLPFYMDQDGSWGADWDTYKNLSQFSSWKKHTFDSFTGLRPNAYFEAKQMRDEVHARLLEKRKEHEAQHLAFDRVHQVLPKNLPSLDFSSFRAELGELSRKSLKIQQKQSALRGNLIAVVNLREKLDSELKLATAARRELFDDLTYLSDIRTPAIECPTCGTSHENSFHARLELSQDADEMAALISTLRHKLDQVEKEEEKVKTDASAVARSMDDLQNLMQEKRAKLKFEDVLATHSKKTLDAAFQRVSRELTAVIAKLEREEDVHERKLKVLTDRDRQAQVRKYYAEQVNSLSTLLNVPPEERVGKPEPGSRAEAGGSSAPRSMLAVHLALLNTNAQFGDSPQFPFVVDTPQQSGQDPENLRLMIEVLQRTAGKSHQIVLATESLPSATRLSDYDLVPFEEGRGALRSEEFEEVLEFLRTYYEEMKGHLAKSSAVEKGLAA